MNLHDFKALLRAHPDTLPRFILPDGDTIPAHFHVTEVGHVAKKFVDCGGTFRDSEACVLQTYVAGDFDHRLTSGKLATILDLGRRILPSDDLPVEMEYEDCATSQFPLAGGELAGEYLNFHLTSKHTDCLDKEACGLQSDGGTSGCC